MKRNLFCKNKTFAFIILTILVIVGSVAFSNRVFSYNDTITHPSLTDNIAKVCNTNFDRKLSDEEINWLKQGSIEEDRVPRWMNHFYDPIAGVGLLGGFSSMVWAESSFLQIKNTGDNQTWQRAINSYAAGDKKEAFVALGHILHLLEDVTVPAHTRLDSHPEGDPYESYAVDKIGENINFNVAPVTVKELSATFDSLANYSNKYFLSEDTINDDFLKNKEVIVEKIGVNKFIEYIKGADNSGKNFHLALVEGSYFNKNYITNDNLVHSDYFSLLAPKAISYGAGVVKLFFDEAERAKQEYEKKSWWEKLKDGANQLFSGFSGSLYAGIGLEESAPSDASGASRSEAPATMPSIASEPVSSVLSLPANAVMAQEKIIVNLPPSTVVAQEKLGGNIAEEIVPRDARIPSAIVEEVIPAQANLPSPSPITFLPGMGGASPPSTTPTPSPGPDATPPQTTLVSQPSNPVASTSAAFIFTSSESGSTFGCQLDGAATSSCVSPQEYNNLSETSHNFKVSATDAAGNQDLTPAEYSWTVDLTAPQLSSIASTPGRTSALISWTASEAGIFQIEHGTSTSYDLTTATTSAVSLTINSLTASTTYHFRLLAQDSLGNATSSVDNIFTTTSQAESVVISEIQISGATATDEFVELYNPTNSDVNLLGWRLSRKTSSGATLENLFTSFPDKIILAKGYFLISHPTGYNGSVPADAVYSTANSIASSSTVILYSDSGDTIVDLVGLGMASSSETATISNPGDNQSIERKANATSTKELLVNGAHQWQGNNFDSDNNSQDFVLQDKPNPQNSLMLTEPRATVPGLMTASAWPTWQGNLARNGQASAASLATSTMAVKWTATTTLAQSFISRPVLDSAGNIYIGRADGLAKYSSNGNLVWLYILASNGAPSPLISDDGTIFFRNAGALYAINQDGQLKWKYSLDGAISVNAALAFAQDGAIITQGGQKIFVINQDATPGWSFDLGREVLSSSGASALIVDNSGNIFMAMDKYVYAFSPAGRLLWEKGDDLGWLSSMSLSGNVLYLTAGINPPFGGVYALNTADGSIVWSNANGFNDKAYLAPAIDSADNIYVILFYFGSHHLNAYSASATSTSFLIYDNSFSASLAAPILTSDGKIYLADQNYLRVFDAATGNLDGSFDSGESGFYQYFGAVGSDGTIYSASSNAFGGILFAIGSGG